MINFQELEKVAEFKNGELNWLEGRDINAVYVILVGNEYYIGSSHYTYLRIGQHLHHLKSGVHHSGKLQTKFNKIGEFEVYVLERGIEREKLQYREYEYIRSLKPSLNIIAGIRYSFNSANKPITIEPVIPDGLVYRFENGMMVTDSEKIAKAFDVCHSFVVKKIKAILEQICKIEPAINGDIECACSFFTAVFKDGVQTLENLYYIISREGFSLLCSCFAEECFLLPKLRIIDLFYKECNVVRAELTGNINSLTRKQIAQMLLDCENSKERMMDEIGELKSLLQEIKE